MAYIDYGPWINPITGSTEIVEGVWCQCYECKRISSDNWSGYEQNIFYTKTEYRIHQDERRNAYNAYIEDKISREELKSARPKETGASSGHGRPDGVTTLFDLETGNMVPDPSIYGAVRWETLYRASIRDF